LIRGKKPRWVYALAEKRILKLLKMAEENVKTHPQRTKRYVELARKISSKYNVRITRELKRKICKKCNAFLIPGFNCKVRADRKTKCITYICLECGERKRYGYSK